VPNKSVGWKGLVSKMLITFFGGLNVNKFVDNLLILFPIDLFNPNKRCSFTALNKII
jgi:hypothetical protein